MSGTRSGKGFLRGGRAGRRQPVMRYALALMVFGNVAAAEELKVPLRVEIEATRDCPPPDDFYAEVRQRTEYARRARDGELGWSAAVTIKEVGNRRLARLTLRATEGEWIERELVAPTCGDALEALAVVLAVLIDTAVEQAHATNSSSSADTEPPPPHLISLPRVATGVYIPWIDDPDFFEKRGISLNASRFIASVNGGLELDTQLVNGAAFGMGLGFEIERWNPNLLRPSLGLSLGWSTGEVGDDDLRANLQRWSIRAHLCPFDLAQGRAISLRPCGRIDAGYVYAYQESTSNDNPQNESRRFGMVRISPFLRLDFVVASGAHLRFDAGLDLAVRRPDIVFYAKSEPRAPTLIHSPSPAGAYGAMAVAVEF